MATHPKNIEPISPAAVFHRTAWAPKPAHSNPTHTAKRSHRPVPIRCSTAWMTSTVPTCSRIETST